MAEEVKQQVAPERMSLREFIENYQKTIAVIGVFMALGLFWKTTYPGTSIPFISYLCFFITIPLLLEVRSGYKHEIAEWRLSWFIDMFTAIFLLTAVHLLTDFPDHLGRIVTASTVALFYFFLGRKLAKSREAARDKLYSTLTDTFKKIDLLDETVDQKNARKNYANKVYSKAINRRELADLLFLVAMIGLLFAVLALFTNYVEAYVDVELPFLRR